MNVLFFSVNRWENGNFESTRLLKERLKERLKEIFKNNKIDIF